ncbi:unnamed protein product [Mytilus edulis]|uniref:Uncharacterized protein n=1 Tax=Mytilus edulis TaxID=6550 RepID=A0A8S3RR38_MYTED|nr:unnamed protein product [Mytilus edulis]
MQTLKTQSAKALWFAETYGLTPKNLVFETEHGEDINIRFGEQTESQSENDEIRLKEILFLLDKFAISDQAYHEIAMKTNDLPKFYLIKNCRDKFNEGIQLERTPGNVPGAFLNFRSEVENAIKQKFDDVPTDDAQKKVRIKVSGDGTKVSRISNYVVMSFSLIDDATSLSSVHQKTLAIVKCTENYENIRSSLKPLFDDINKLYSEGADPINIFSLTVQREILDRDLARQILDNEKLSLKMHPGNHIKFIKFNRGKVIRPLHQFKKFLKLLSPLPPTPKKRQLNASSEKKDSNHLTLPDKKATGEGKKWQRFLAPLILLSKERVAETIRGVRKEVVSSPTYVHFYNMDTVVSGNKRRLSFLTERCTP